MGCRAVEGETAEDILPKAMLVNTAGLGGVCVCDCSQFGDEAVICNRNSLPYHYFVDFSVVMRNLRAVLRIYIILPWFCCSDLSVSLSLFRFTDRCGILMEAGRNPSGSIPICPRNISREWILITRFGIFNDHNLHFICVTSWCPQS